MKRKDFEDYRDIKLEINQLLAEKKSLNILPGKVADGMPRAKNQTSDATIQTVLKILAIEDSIYYNIRRLAQIRDGVEAAIEGLKSKERTLMRLRYYDGLKYREIAAKMHYDKDYIAKMHGKILARLVDDE